MSKTTDDDFFKLPPGQTVDENLKCRGQVKNIEKQKRTRFVKNGSGSQTEIVCQTGTIYLSGETNETKPVQFFEYVLHGKDRPLRAGDRVAFRKVPIEEISPAPPKGRDELEVCEIQIIQWEQVQCELKATDPASSHSGDLPAMELNSMPFGPAKPKTEQNLLIISEKEVRVKSKVPEPGKQQEEMWSHCKKYIEDSKRENKAILLYFMGDFLGPAGELHFVYLKKSSALSGSTERMQWKTTADLFKDDVLMIDINHSTGEQIVADLLANSDILKIVWNGRTGIENFQSLRRKTQYEIETHFLNIVDAALAFSLNPLNCVADLEQVLKSSPEQIQKAIDPGLWVSLFHDWNSWHEMNQSPLHLPLEDGLVWLGVAKLLRIDVILGSLEPPSGFGRATGLTTHMIYAIREDVHGTDALIRQIRFMPATMYVCKDTSKSRQRAMVVKILRHYASLHDDEKKKLHLSEDDWQKLARAEEWIAQSDQCLYCHIISNCWNPRAYFLLQIWYWTQNGVTPKKYQIFRCAGFRMINHRLGLFREAKGDKRWEAGLQIGGIYHPWNKETFDAHEPFCWTCKPENPYEWEGNLTICMFEGPIRQFPFCFKFD